MNRPATSERIPTRRARTLLGAAVKPASAGDRSRGQMVRKLALWVGLPAVGLIGVTLWFTLVPGRSGAG
jgi:hypothetical protein